MAIIDSQIRLLKKYMEDSSFTYTDEWLLACVEWVKDNFPSVTLEILKRQLLEQWKDANLEEMESSCLPPNLTGQKLIKLPGKYGVQINSVRDIGESSYSQWTKVKKLQNENTTVAATDSTEFKQTWEPKPKRCLYLNITDGRQQVFGLEMHPIGGLSVDMKPGTKIIIVGPVDCRRGVFHLKPTNIRVIGGEVEDLFNSNKMESILATALKINPANNDTRSQAASNLPSTNRATTQVHQPQATARGNNNNINATVGEFPDSEDQFLDLDAGNSNPFDDDDIFMEIDEEALISSASNRSISTTRTSQNLHNQTTQKISVNSGITTDPTEFIEDYDDDDIPIVIDPPDPPSYSRVATNSKGPSRLTAISNVNVAAPKKCKQPFVPPPTVTPKSSLPCSVKTSMYSTTAKHSSTESEKMPNIKSSNSIMSAPSFRSAKSSVNLIGKQQNILHYMKPMPVIIDPPTPERQAKRRRKTESSNGASDHIMMAEDDLDDEANMMNNSPDDTLMKIIDETVENRLLEADTEMRAAGSTTVNRVNSKFPIMVSEKPYIFLKQVQERIRELADQRKVVHVKACISTIVSNIKVGNGQWTLRVCINDGTGFLNCSISGEILNRVIGFTPSEMKKMKAEKTSSGKEQIAEGMKQLAQRLVHLNAIFAIEVGEDPMIVEIVNLMLHHSTAVKGRLRNL